MIQRRIDSFLEPLFNLSYPNPYKTIRPVRMTNRRLKNHSKSTVRGNKNMNVVNMQSQPLANQQPREGEEMVVRYLTVSEAFKGKKFESFDELRVMSNRLVNDARNDWVNACLVKNGIIINTKRRLTKRELVEAFEKNNITLVREFDEKEDFDVIYHGERVIGKWSNKRQIHFGQRTEKLYIKIEYIVL